MTNRTYVAFDALFEGYRYPAGESHIRRRDLPRLEDGTVIEAKTTGFEGLMQVVTANRILRRRREEVRWFLPYFPFARHDRRNDAFDGFELELALEIVRELDVVIADPHSDVAGQLCHIPQSAAVACFRDAGLFEGDPWIIVPDVGAAKKAMSWKGPKEIAIQAMKKRDPMTGALSGFRLLSTDLQERPCVMVDDICDGGGTFLGLADELVEKGAGSLSLAITHGLFTRGVDRLRQRFDQIFTFHFAGERPAEGVTSIPFETLYAKGQWL